MAEVLMKLAKAIAKRRVKVVDLTQTLRPSTPVIALPPPFAPSNPFDDLRDLALRRARTRLVLEQHLVRRAHRHAFRRADPLGHGQGFPERRAPTPSTSQRFVAPACVIDCSKEAAKDEDFLVTPKHIMAWEKKHGEIPTGAWVLMRTDWSKRQDPARFLNMQGGRRPRPGPERRRGALPRRGARRDRLGRRDGRHRCRTGLRLRAGLPGPHADARREQVRAGEPVQPRPAAADRCDPDRRAAEDRERLRQPAAGAGARLGRVADTSGRDRRALSPSPRPAREDRTMAERSFKEEVQKLHLGDGEEFRGEGILAVTKALLQSGVSYVGGYQGAPISHLMDVLADANDILAELGVHFESSASEATAAAMLAASVNYPLRGAVTFKSTVGTNVASDALANLASGGVTGGALIIVGEDYGEGSSIMQERTHAFAMKSQIWLLDPRPNLPSIVAHGGDRASSCPRPRTRRSCWSCASAPAMSMAASWPRTTCGRRFTLQGCAGEPAARRRTASSCRRRASCTSRKRSRSAGRPPSSSSASNGSTSSSPDEAADIGIVVQGGLYNTAAARARAARACRRLRAHRACRSTCSTSPIR